MSSEANVDLAEQLLKQALTAKAVDADTLSYVISALSSPTPHLNEKYIVVLARLYQLSESNEAEPSVETSNKRKHAYDDKKDADELIQTKHLKDGNEADDSASSSSDNDESSPTAKGVVSPNKEAQQKTASRNIHKNEEEKIKSKNILENKVEDSSKFNPLFHNFLWIYQLPEWLKNDILNSNLMRSLFQSLEQSNAIYSLKSMAEIFATLFSYQPEDYQTDSVENTKEEKVICAYSSEVLVDTSIIDTSINIIPMSVIGFEGVPDFGYPTMGIF